ncbi:hypothetical protein ACFQ4K_10900 [Tistrella bauzanensis]
MSMSTFWIGVTGSGMEAMTLAGTGADAVRAVAGEDGRAKAGPSPAALGLDAALGWAASRSLAEAINGGTFARLAAGRADPTELATAVGLSVDRLLAQLAALGAQGLLYLEDDGQVILNPQARDAAAAAAALLAAGVPAAPAAISWPVLDPAIGGWAGALLRPRGRWLVLVVTPASPRASRDRARSRWCGSTRTTRPSPPHWPIRGRTGRKGWTGCWSCVGWAASTNR